MSSRWDAPGLSITHGPIEDPQRHPRAQMWVWGHMCSCTSLLIECWFAPPGHQACHGVPSVQQDLTDKASTHPTGSLVLWKQPSQ